MSQVILTPIGWKYLPNTVSWPEKPQCICETQGFDACEKAIDDYHNAVREASRHLVDIAEEDWDRIKYYIPGIKPLITPIQSDTPYTIDAEFEVGWEIINQWDGDDIPVTTDPDAAWIDRRQIARLVKPKEDRCNGSKFCDCAKQAMTNGANRDWVDQTEDNCKFKPTPTDSVTSDGTKVNGDGTIFEFLSGSHSFEGVWFGDRHPTRKGAYWWRSVLREALEKPTETQDELLERIIREEFLINTQDYPNEYHKLFHQKLYRALARFRIERI